VAPGLAGLLAGASQILFIHLDTELFQRRSPGGSDSMTLLPCDHHTHNPNVTKFFFALCEPNQANNSDTKQAVNAVVEQLVGTGHFEAVDNLRCLDSGMMCKGPRLRLQEDEGS
jgi:hypothetical protein